MKKLLIVSGIVALGLGFNSASLISYPSAKTNSFKSGEKLRYRVTYGFMDAGEAILSVNETSKKGAGRSLYHVKGEGRTLGGFNLFYKVEDTYESYLDKQGAFPWYFKRRVNEGGYKISQDYTFKQDKQRVNNGEKDFKVPLGIQDMISSFYYARTLDFENMKKGQITSFNCFMDDEIWPLKVKFVEKEEINIRKGKFDCLKFVPVVQEGRYFKNEDDVEFWVTNDKNRIPVLVKAKIPVGTIKMHLVEWEGLKYKLAKK
jgi:hypothetical protein